jgi:hypothetical protein
MTLVWMTLVQILVPCDISTNANAISVNVLNSSAFWNCKQLLSSTFSSKVTALHCRLKFVWAFWSCLCEGLLKSLKFHILYVKCCYNQAEVCCNLVKLTVLRFAEGHEILCKIYQMLSQLSWSLLKFAMQRFAVLRFA